MKLHEIHYKVLRTGSSLFDGVIIDAAKRICAELSGIRCEVTETEIRIYGALDDANYARYEQFMFGSGSEAAQEEGK